MSGFLLDTNVISLLSPVRAEASERFLQWLERVDSEGRVFLSVIAIHEIEKGIALLERKGASAKAASLRGWLVELVATYDDKIFPIDALAAGFVGQLEAKAISGGHDPGMADALIAGVAKAHNLMIVTLNTKHFLPFGIDVVTPDEAVKLT